MKLRAHVKSFGKRIFIEQEDFREEANKKFKRLKKGMETGGAYVIKCEDCGDTNGTVTKLL